MLAGNPRMIMQVRNLQRIKPAEQTAIRSRANQVRAQIRGNG